MIATSSMITVAMTLLAATVTPFTVPTIPGASDDLRRLSGSVRTFEQRVTTNPSSWLALERAASARMERAHFTGNYDDYQAAVDLLDRAFALAPKGAGPHLTRATLNFTLHRLDRVEADLTAAEQRIILNDPTKAAIVGLRADVAFQRGEYAAARHGFEEAIALHPGPGALARLANYHAKTGDADRADSLFVAGAAKCHTINAHPRAWYPLQRGLLDLAAGRLDDALAHYAEAEAICPGWWLVEEHVAEIWTLQGFAGRAIERYEDLFERTGNPEFLDALSKIHVASGNSAGAAETIARARVLHEQHLRAFPEAAAGHALNHFLEFGKDRARTLELAICNAKLRGNGAALTLLARAHRQAGDFETADAVLERVHNGPWRE